MVDRLKNPKIYRGACSYHLSKLVRSKFKVEYSTEVFFLGYGFDKNKILIYNAYGSGFKKSVFLLITLDHLDHIVSFQDNDTFIIPANLVYPSIAASSGNTVTQYHELANAVNDYLKTKAEHNHTSHKH